MATTFKVLLNGTQILSMCKLDKEKHIDEDDLIYEYDEVKDKYPNTSKEEFDLQQKELQEV